VHVVVDVEVAGRCVVERAVPERTIVTHGAARILGERARKIRIVYSVPSRQEL